VARRRGSQGEGQTGAGTRRNRQVPQGTQAERQRGVYNHVQHQGTRERLLGMKAHCPGRKVDLLGMTLAVTTCYRQGMKVVEKDRTVDMRVYIRIAGVAECRPET